ncbi:MAG: hypothetical protein QXW37_02255 [Candidatus Nitrosotenuis sp.]
MVKKKDELPDWVLDGIKNAKFENPETTTRTGYILEVYEDDKKIDAHLYEQVADGRHIVTMDLPKSINPSDCQRGVVYEFAFDVLKAPLDKKIAEFLKKEKEIDMDAIYQFELKKMELLDVASDETSSDEAE